MHLETDRLDHTLQHLCPSTITHHHPPSPQFIHHSHIHPSCDYRSLTKCSLRGETPTHTCIPSRYRIASEGPFLILSSIM